jgi:RNase P subunit RPR2
MDGDPQCPDCGCLLSEGVSDRARSNGGQLYYCPGCGWEGGKEEAEWPDNDGGDD